MESGNYRPQPWRVSKIATAFMDYTTGEGVLDSGHPFRSNISRGRKNPTLTDKLETVHSLAPAGIEKIRIMLTGKVPPADRNGRHWLMVQTPGWNADRGHWLGSPPTGRFTHNLTGRYIEIRVASEWFGDTNLTPRQARDAWDYLDSMLSFTFGPSLPSDMKTTLMLSPAATGTNLWAATMPNGLNPEPVTDDIAEELHASSGQHHLEHLVSGPSIANHEDVLALIDAENTPKIPQFSYIDGRFMYASLCREIGTGPGVRLRQSEAYDLLQSNPYARARYEVRFTVPDNWNHVGIFGMKHKNPSDGWYYPNRPKAQGITWADASEVFVALKYGWHVEPLQAVRFNETMSTARKRFYGSDEPAKRKATKARPLDLWAEKLMTARDNVAHDHGIDETLRKAISSALRAILIQSIGSFASRGRGATAVTDDPKFVPPQYADSISKKGKLFVYTIPQKLTGRQASFYRPEFAAQIWGRGRAKVLSGRVGNTEVGALTLPGSSIIGINGDAIYTTELPLWSFPTEQGGADDGKAGRLRLQGALQGPLVTPSSRAQRDRLRDRAIKAGTAQAIQDQMDQASFGEEFVPTADSSDFYAPGDEE